MFGPLVLEDFRVCAKKKKYQNLSATEFEDQL